MSLCDCRQGRDPCTCKPVASFQDRVQPWMLECFGLTISADYQERNHRFLEEALELVQARGATASEAHQLVDYVYGRPAGDPVQEVGGVMVTLAALCLANGMDMHAAAETELARIWTMVEQIRAKQAAKPAMSPLPGVYPERELPADGTDYDYRTDLSAYFGLSYASWLTLPRVLMEAMPDDWKRGMARLLHEYEDTYTNQPEYGTTVRVTVGGQLAPTPEWLINYRHPDWAMIDQVRGVKTEAPRNQCDGCQAGIPVVNGAHRMGKPGGYADTMSCTAKLYESIDNTTGLSCNQIREESGLPINTPCAACHGGACIDR